MIQIILKIIRALNCSIFGSETLILCCFAIALLGTSCASTKGVNYFPEIKDEVIANKVPVLEPQIQLNDLLSIIVTSSNPEASALFNAPNESANATVSAAASANTLTIGYLVNQNGDILFPTFGSIHVVGLTKFQLSTLITQKI